MGELIMSDRWLVYNLANRPYPDLFSLLSLVNRRARPGNYWEVLGGRCLFALPESQLIGNEFWGLTATPDTPGRLVPYTWNDLAFITQGPDNGLKPIKTFEDITLNDSMAFSFLDLGKVSPVDIFTEEPLCGKVK